MTETRVSETPLQRKALRILVVDSSPDTAGLQELARELPGEWVRASGIEEARRAMGQKAYELVLCRDSLPAGEPGQVIPLLRSRRRDSALVLMGENPSAEQVLQAFRCGVADYLCLPMEPALMLQRLRKTLQARALEHRSDQRLTRLRHALRRMNESRKLISQKVDVICGDLVAAYGQLAKDLDTLRTQQDYRQAIEKVPDLEGLICATMDWLLKKLGYANVGIWMRGKDAEFELGAYMKHTIPASKPLLKAIRAGLVQKTLTGPLLIRGSAETCVELSIEERGLLKGQSILAASTTFLGEAIAVLVLFRDEKTPFTDEQLGQLKQVIPLLGTALSRMMGTAPSPDHDLPADGSTAGNEDPPRQDPSDWWKRGESPPF